jgi:hypothetical protein
MGTIDLDAIPPALTALPRWVCWRYRTAKASGPRCP